MKIVIGLGIIIAKITVILTASEIHVPIRNTAVTTDIQINERSLEVQLEDTGITGKNINKQETTPGDNEIGEDYATPESPTTRVFVTNTEIKETSSTNAATIAEEQSDNPLIITQEFSTEVTRPNEQISTTGKNERKSSTILYETKELPIQVSTAEEPHDELTATNVSEEKSTVISTAPLTYEEAISETVLQRSTEESISSETYNKRVLDTGQIASSFVATSTTLEEIDHGSTSNHQTFSDDASSGSEATSTILYENTQVPTEISRKDSTIVQPAVIITQTFPRKTTTETVQIFSTTLSEEETTNIEEISSTLPEISPTARTQIKKAALGNIKPSEETTTETITVEFEGFFTPKIIIEAKFTTHPQTEISEDCSSEVICHTEGYFRYNESCTEFYHCYFSTACNKIIPSGVYTCPACLKFSAKTRRCDFPELVPECTYLSIEQDKEFCTGPGIFPVPDDCHKYYECSASNKHEVIDLAIKSCPLSSTFDENSKTCTEEGRCNVYPNPENCDFTNIYENDKFNCNRFFLCSSVDEALIFNCSEDFVFNAQYCEPKSASYLSNWEEVLNRLKNSESNL